MAAFDEILTTLLQSLHVVSSPLSILEYAPLHKGRNDNTFIASRNTMTWSLSLMLGGRFFQGYFDLTSCHSAANKSFDKVV